MVERKFLVMRKGKVLDRQYTKEKAQTRKKQLQNAGVKGLSIKKQSSNYGISFKNSKGKIVISKSKFKTKKEAENIIKDLKNTEKRVKGKISPQVKSSKVFKIIGP